MLYQYEFLLAFVACAATQQIARDPGVTGPPLEVVHQYNDEFVTGICSCRKVKRVDGS